jgi:glycosyltransferase involved in cell wall biosynthesis
MIRDEVSRPGAPARPAAAASLAVPAGAADPRYRVLMIAPTSFFGDYGCPIRILEETRSLEQLGHEVTIVTYYKGRDVPGLRIVRTRPTPWRPNYEVGSSRHKLVFDLLLSYKALKVALRLRPDVIHAHLHEGALIGGVLARLLRRPLVFDLQGSLTSEMVAHHFLNPQGPWYGPACWLERAIDQLPDAILTSSQNAAEQVVERWGVPRARVTTLPDSVNSDTFRPATESEQGALLAYQESLGIPRERRVIVYTGLLADYQGTPTLLDMLAALRARGLDAHLLIAGWPAEHAYRVRAAEMGLAPYTTILGRQPYEEMPRLLRLGTVAVSPKLSESEANLKLLGYMAAALPVVVYDTRVNREYLGPLGSYAPPRDLAAYVERLAELLGDPARAAAQGQALRRRALQHYDWEAAGREIAAIYGRIGARARSLAPAQAETYAG